MRVLVTGSEGFIGSNLSERLERDGHMVFGFDLKSGRDLKNFAQIRRVLRETQPEVIFHLAATPGVRYSQEHPAECVGNNVIGTFNLLEALRVLELDAKVVFAGSSSVYVTKSDPVDEDVETDPLSTYPATKICCESLLTAYYKCYGLPIVFLRYFSVYGPLAEKHRPDMLIPKTVMLASKGKSPIIYGDGKQTRDFCVTGDTLILMGNCTWKPIRDVKLGDEIISFDEHPINKKRRFKVSQVKKKNSYVSSNVYEIKTENGSVKATGNHPWLMPKRGYRATLKLKKNMKQYKNQKLRKFSEPFFVNENRHYRIGYVVGSIEGDGYACCYKHLGESTIYRVSLEVTDKEFRDVVHSYFKEIGLSPKLCERQFRYPNSKRVFITRTAKKNDYYKLLNLLKNKNWKNADFCRGYLAGMYDSEGEFDNTRGQLRISNRNMTIIENIRCILKKFDFKWSEYNRKDGLVYLRLLGGLNEHVRFFSTFQPKISRKRADMNKHEVKGSLTKIKSINKKSDQRVHNIEVEGTHTYIANGFLCHNTYISDAVYGTILASEKKQAIGEKINLGSGVSHSVNSVVDQVVRLFPEKGVKPVYRKMELKERRHVCADISKAKRLLGYEPKISLEQGLRKFVEYYKRVVL